MTRHASAEDLAGLDLDALKPRKAARVRAHVASCVQCTQLASQVSAVPALLASTPYPSMPPSLATQLDATLARETAQRVASAPATEAGRRDLPARHARRSRGRFQLPGIPGIATRLVAAAGALVLVGVGGYEIAAHVGGGGTGTTASSAGSAALPSARQLTPGPTVHYGQFSAPKTIQTVHAATNFTRADLGTLAVAAVRAAKLEGAGGTRASAPAPTSAGSASNGLSSQAVPQSSSIASCLDGLVGSQPVLLVETAKFDGQPATIIVTGAAAGRSAQVWAVGPDCSASHPDVRAHETLSHV
jgi:hypothetical protein